MNLKINRSYITPTRSFSRFRNSDYFGKKSLIKILIVIYLTFIVLSQIPLFAENFDYSDMVSDYEAHLSFPKDGKSGHYYVERYRNTEEGNIHVTYTTKSNTLEVDCTNIKVLKIYCREMYEKKSQEVFNKDPGLDSNYYKTYFINRDHFYVHVYTKKMISELHFIDTPIPYNVTVNGREWWLSGINYTYKNDGIVITKVPTGHSYIDIYFQSNNKNSPTARFSASKTIAGVGESITFDASTSSDPDGSIISYVWDFGDGRFRGGETVKIAFDNKGKYNVMLTVTDDDYLIDRAFEEITIIDRVMIISKSVDKPIATPGSILNYTISLSIDSNWTTGLKEIFVTDTLPGDLAYFSATPLPQLQGNTVSWKLGIAFDNSELPIIKLQTVVTKETQNNTVISNYATLNYKGINDQQFPKELSNSVNTRINVGTILAPRIKIPIDDIELFEDAPPYSLYLNSYEYDFHDSGTNLKWYITNKNASLYIISGEYSNDDIITITPLPNKFGNSLVTLWLVDSEGYTTSQPLWINITPINDNPIFSSAPNLIIHYNEPFTFNYEPYIHDIDSSKDSLKLYASENIGPEGFEKINSQDNQDNSDINNIDANQNEHLVINGLKVTYTYPEAFVGKTIYVSLIVFDGEGSSGDTIQVNVTDDYTPILKRELPDVFLFEGETKKNVFDIDEYFDDPDKDSLFYSYGETHILVEINNDHTVDITAPNNWHGVETVIFRARDPLGAIAEDDILVTVYPINDPPMISGIPDYFIIHYDSDYIFDLTPYISDEDNETEDLFLILSDQYIRTDPLNHLKIIMNYPKSMFGLEIRVRLTVSDGIDTDSSDVMVKITDSWPPELINELPDISFFEDDELQNAFNLNNFFTDRDSNALYFSYGQKNVKITINPDGSVDFTAEPNWYGVEKVTFKATDPVNAFVESVILVTVNPVNDPPVLKPLPNQEGIEKQLWKFDLSNYIYDIDNEISELTINVYANNIDITVKDKELLIYSSKPTLENISITVSDGFSESSQNMIIKIGAENSQTPIVRDTGFDLLWLFIFLIIIIISITGFTYWRRYIGDYKIEEVFCISNNGILISHISSNKIHHMANEQIVSGMLTAVLSFTQDAFSDEIKNKKAWNIKEIQMNEKNILIERGNHVYLATVFTGKSGKRLYSKSRIILKNLEHKFKNEFKFWDGNVTKLSSSKEILNSMLSNK